MNIHISKKEKLNLANNEIDILIQYSNNNKDISELERYINKFEERKQEIFVKHNNKFVPISKDSIIKIYSVGKSNYCNTLSGNYEVKNRLYEIEKMDENFMRISKSCIINICHVACFDLNHTGKIIIKFDNDTEEFVSRRKARDVLYYLDERRM